MTCKHRLEVAVQTADLPAALDIKLLYLSGGTPLMLVFKCLNNPQQRLLAPKESSSLVGLIISSTYC